ncbi:MAG: Cof-type HAD-IIB family hydrolase [Lachnospiraceae bacterium]|nr:Cof-type HAD-IIB family hydrolase [Lachnospiraceae bacterium]
MGYVDLHTHSSYSDGTLTPCELVDYAVEKGLSAIALTDHDTVDGLDEMIAYAKGKTIEVIPGIEYSTEYNNRDVHIVGLYIDYKAPVFLEYLARFQKSRTDRNHKLCTNLQGAGIDITYEVLKEAFPDAVITRAHYAKFLLDKGYVKSRNEAFDRYLGDHTPYFVHREKITPEEVIDVTLKAGGIPILAHPTLYKLGREQLEVLVSRLKDAGLMGIECIYSTYSPSEEKQMKELAQKYNLLPSGGSDFHGANKPGLDLGVGYGKLYIPDEILAGMKKTLDTKILFTDLDGTLLNTDRQITERAREKILEMLSKGNHFVLASGRSIDSIFNVLETLDIQQYNSKGKIYISASNGAVLYDCTNNTVIKQYDVPISTAKAIFDIAIKKGIHIQTYTDTHIISCADDKEIKYYRKAIKTPYKVGTELDKELIHAPAKLLAINLDDRARLEALRKEIEASEIGNDITCAFSNPYYLEFYNKKAGKGNGLKNLCSAIHVHIKNSVAAGDEENDISMLEAAGVGVCMANGNPMVKEHADYVTEHDNNHDGIVEIIDLFVGKG